MAWEKWQFKNYDHLDKTGKYHHAHGQLPTGAKVKFTDGTEGTVINSNAEKSLISHAAPRGSGAQEERAWYKNSILLVQE